MNQESASKITLFHTREADFRAVFVSASDAINAAQKQIGLHEHALYHFSEMVVCANMLSGLFQNTNDI
ncbi:MAG TPA: hypothetical protein PLY93_15400, partial [Turneriella sp.]|nr:hypothetical protein [Turneriella sp.]